MKPVFDHPLTMHPVAYARNGFSDKFGIPRQVREQSRLLTRIVFTPAYRNADAIRGIEQFSHLWLLWGFHTVPETDNPSLTVRPPRLGGNTRMGVFATRSPFRPNPIGLTSVRLIAVEHTTEGSVLVVEGADMLDGTPIYDIKPYLGYCDSHLNTRDGFVDTTPRQQLTVLWPDTLPKDLPHDELQEILEQDPRPAYHQDAQREYGLDYAGWNIRFRVQETTLHVLKTCRAAKG